jgi:hypothetical protein
VLTFPPQGQQQQQQQQQPQRERPQRLRPKPVAADDLSAEEIAAERWIVASDYIRSYSSFEEKRWRHMSAKQTSQPLMSPPVSSPSKSSISSGSADGAAQGMSPEANSPTSRKLVSQLSRNPSVSIAANKKAAVRIKIPNSHKKVGPVVVDRALNVIPKMTLSAAEMGCETPMPSQQSLGEPVEVNVEGQPGWRRKTDQGHEILAVLYRVSPGEVRHIHMVPKYHPYVRLVIGKACAPDEFSLSDKQNKDASRVPAVIRLDQEKGWLLELLTKAPGRIGKLIIKSADEDPSIAEKPAGNAAYSVKLDSDDDIDVCQAIFTFSLTV